MVEWKTDVTDITAFKFFIYLQ